MADDRFGELARLDRYGDEPRAHDNWTLGAIAALPESAAAYLPDVTTGPDEPVTTERQRSQRAAQLARQSEGVNPVVDILKSIPAAAARGAKSFLVQAGSGMDPIPFDPEVSQEQQRLGFKGTHEAARQMEQGIKEHLYQPQTLPGHFGHSVVEIGTNPNNWLGPGSIPFKAGWNVISGLTGEAGAQAYKGTPYEETARIVGSFSPMVAERAAALAPGALARLPGAFETAFNAVVPSSSAGAIIGGRIPRAPPQVIRPAVNENIPVPVRERAQMRDELAAGKRAYEETLPPSSAVLPEDFLRTAVERKAAAPGELAALDRYQTGEVSHGQQPVRPETELDVGAGVAGTSGGGESLRQARLQAQRRAGGYLPLEGLPTAKQIVEGEPFIPGPVGRAHDVAEQYMAGKNFGVAAPTKFHPLDKEHSARVAQAFDALPLYDARALPSYEAMIRETLAQYQAIKNSGLKITPVDAGAYPYGSNPRAVAKDVADNNHMAFFKTEPEAGAFGSAGETGIAQNHPLLRPSGEYIGDYQMLNNDLFRVVHDYFGHIKNGYGFRAAGEDNAWRSHAAMYSPEARPAMTAETRGQNSWVNYGPHGDFNRTASGADTIYSPQKVALMPDWTMGDLAPSTSPAFRDVIVRGPDGRPRYTARLPIGTEGEILRRGAERVLEPERIVGAAVKGENRVFAADQHWGAANEAGRYYGVEDPIGAGLLKDVKSDGFLTNKGRYVSREEALRIADAAGQSKPGPLARQGRLETSETRLRLEDREGREAALAAINARLRGEPQMQAAARQGPPFRQEGAVGMGGIAALDRPYQPADVSRLTPRNINKFTSGVAQRVAFPGVYKDPRLIAAEAAANTAPEHPALKALFGVTRDDLYGISQGGTRQGNMEPRIWMPEKGRGSYAAEAIMNKRNAQRMIDALTEAEKYPQLTRGMDAWYVMDPAFQRMVQLVGREQAIKDYQRFNMTVPPFSAGSSVLTEINRGTAANMMAARGEYPTFAAHAGTKERARGPDFPPELRDVMGHAYHGVQSDAVTRYLATGEHGYHPDTVKIPLYSQASGVPETGFQTRLPVPDAHFARASGMADVRKSQDFADYMGGSEYRPYGPWYRENVAKPLGIEAVPAQGRMWGVYAPQTGVETAVGAPKLELLAQAIWERAQRLGIDPRKLRDDVLTGKGHANWLLPTAGGVFGMGALADQGEYRQ
jgi:hypothetical protein